MRMKKRGQAPNFLRYAAEGIGPGGNSEPVPVFSVSVVVPCLNEAGSIERLLNAVRAQDAPILEVIVVDGGSTDGTQAILEDYGKKHPDFPLTTLLRPGVTLPQGINAGVRAARGDVIVRLDAHSHPTLTYVRQCVEALRQTGAGVVGGVWETEAGDSSATAKAIACAVSHPMGAGDAAYRIGHAGAGRHPIDTVPFGCFRKSTWENLGGYNEQLLTNEDYEFNYRARLAQQLVILDSDIRCAYVARATLKELAAQYFRYGWWKTKMLKQHPLSLRWRQAVPAGFVAMLVALACLSVFFSAARFALAALVLLYGLALIATAVRMRRRVQSWRIVTILPAAFLTVHLSWGTGALVNLLTMGMWPRWKPGS